MQEKDVPSNARVSKKSSEPNGAMWVPRLSAPPEVLGIFSSPCKGKKSDDLKQIDCQVFLQQRWVYSGSAERRWATRKPCTGRERALSRRGRGRREGCGRQSAAFRWLSPCLERRGVLLPDGLCHCCRAGELPVLVSQLYLILPINSLHWVVLVQERILPGQGAQLNKQDLFSFKKLLLFFFLNLFN